MTDTPVTLFALDEADHLTRIHLKLGLEDVGFDVRETQHTIALVGPSDLLDAAATPTLAEAIARRADTDAA